MPDAFGYLLCFKLCRHNRLGPNCSSALFLQEIINFLRQASYGATYATSMSPPVAQMSVSAIKIIMGEDGTNKGTFVLFVPHIRL